MRAQVWRRSVLFNPRVTRVLCPVYTTRKITASNLATYRLQSSKTLSTDTPKAAAGMTSSAPKGYAEAIAALNTLQSNAAIIEAIRKSGGKLNDLALPEMVEYLERIGWTQEDLNRLNVIHVTGTKGKGSTSAFIDALVRSRAGSSSTSSSSKPLVGLYTSPHLVQVRERIRLDGIPISEDMFAKYFWQVWERLGANDRRKHPEMTPVRPVYFRYLTILAYHIFLTLGVQCTILEVGIGGRYDSTNIVPKPVVTGITTLGLDHTALLGNTIEEIAAQKAGIFKQGVPALSVWQQAEGAQKVIAEEAKKLGASPFRQLPDVTSDSIYRKTALGIPGAQQASNAQLAVAMSRIFFQSDAGRIHFASGGEAGGGDKADALSDHEKLALSHARWPGRCQIVRSRPDSSKGDCARTWFLDGAHTTESLESCAKWFLQASAAESQKADGTSSKLAPRKTLIFNTTHDRKSEELLRGMIGAIQAESNNEKTATFDKIIFCTNITYREGKSSGDLTAVAGEVSLDPQRNMQRAWHAIDATGKTTTHALASIEEAIEATAEHPSSDKDAATQHILVTGSLHLVGGVMSHLKDANLLDESLNGRY